MAGALEGVRVVEFANYASGPYAGMLLGDMCADMIKVKKPSKADALPGWGCVECSPTFGSVNRNRKCVTLDLMTLQGKSDPRALIVSADMVIENFCVDTMERLGLGDDQFQKTRGKNYEVLNKALGEVFRINTRDHRLEVLLRKDVPAAPLNTFDDVFANPQVQHLRMRVDVPHPKLGSVGHIRHGTRLSVTRNSIRFRSPELGEHDDEILLPLRRKG